MPNANADSKFPNSLSILDPGSKTNKASFTFTNATGLDLTTTGNDAGTATGSINWSSGAGTGTVTSGQYDAGSGNTVDGASGNTSIASGTTTGTGNSGNWAGGSGNATGTGDTGEARVSTGDATSGDSGDVVLDPGTAGGGGTRGTINATAALKLDEQSAAPAAVANKGFLYTKDDGGDTELFYRDAGGNEVQITADGSINAGSANITTTAGLNTLDISGGSVTLATDRCYILRAPGGGEYGALSYIVGGSVGDIVTFIADPANAPTSIGIQQAALTGDSIQPALLSPTTGVPSQAIGSGQAVTLVRVGSGTSQPGWRVISPVGMTPAVAFIDMTDATGGATDAAMTVQFAHRWVSSKKMGNYRYAAYVPFSVVARTVDTPGGAVSGPGVTIVTGPSVGSRDNAFQARTNERGRFIGELQNVADGTFWCQVVAPYTTDNTPPESAVGEAVPIMFANRDQCVWSA